MDRPRTPDSCCLRREPVDYREALAIQEALAERRLREEVPDILWLLEHRPVITTGSAGGADHLVAGADELAARGFDLVATRRGGDITCHEPGQLVGYPIVRLVGEGDRDLHGFLRSIEEALIRVLAGFGLDGRRVPGRTGVWLDPESAPRKIAAIGVRCARWVTSHGFALNVANDLAGFRLIVPCGIRDGGVTSLERELGRAAGWSALSASLHAALERELRRPLLLVCGDDARSLVSGARPGPPGGGGPDLSRAAPSRG